MASRVPQAAVCIITVELGGERMSLTVRTVRNLDRNLYSARPEVPHPCADVDEVLRVTGNFLRSLERETTVPPAETAR